MYEERRIVISAYDFIKGQSISNENPTGGFSSSSMGVIAMATEGELSSGVLSPIKAISNGDTAQGHLSCSLIDMLHNSTGVAVYYNSGYGYFYNYLNDTLTLLKTSSAGTGSDYYDTPATSDAVYYKGDYYFTTTQNIDTSDVSFTTLKEDWWTATMGKSALTGNPHMMCVYKDWLVIADGYYLHTYDGSTATEQALDIPEDFTIRDIIEFKDMIYILAENKVSMQVKLFTWDGYQDSFLESYTIGYERDTYTFAIFRNTLYIWLGNTLGYFTGVYFEPIKYIGASVNKSQRVVGKKGIYYLNKDKRVEVMYDFIFKKSPSFYTLTDWTFNNILKSASEGIVIGNDNPQLMNVIMSSDTSIRAEAKFYSNIIRFNGKVVIKRIIIETTKLVSGNKMTVEYINAQGETVSVGSMDFSNDGGISLKEFIIVGTRPTISFQLKLSWTGATTNNSVKQIIIYADNSERPITNA